MLLVAQNPSCARSAFLHLPRRSVQQLAFLCDTLCIGPLDGERLPRDQAWRRFAKRREDHWRRLAQGERNPIAEWWLLGPRQIGRARKVVVAVQRDSNGWLILALLLGLSRSRLPPSGWHILWCARRDEGARDLAEEEPRPMAPDEVRDALRLWRCATRPSPEDLAAIEPTSPLAATARRLLSQLPDERSGLTVVEHALLARCAQGPTRINRAIGHVLLEMATDEAVLSEWYFGDRMAKLLASQVVRAHEVLEGRDWWKSTVELTELGADVLAGRASLKARALDEAVCGFRQSSAGGGVWLRREDGGVTLYKAPEARL